MTKIYISVSILQLEFFFEQFWPSFQTVFKQLMNINEAFMTPYWSFKMFKYNFKY